VKRLTRKPQYSAEHVDSEGSWAISYGDMITLLLSFFVLYFTVDPNKVKASQMQQALMMKLQESGISSAQQGFIRRLDLGETPGESVDPKLLLKVGAVLNQVGEQLIVEFNDVSFFELGQVDVNKTGQVVLSSFAHMYTPFAGRYDLKIKAYTDTRKVREGRRFKDNLELSALRSVAAMRILQRAGIPLKDMKIAGFGEFAIEKLNQTRGLASSDRGTVDPLAFARKVVLVIEPKTQERDEQ